MMDALSFGLSKRTVLREIGVGHIAIVKLIKSRIIRKDAVKILEMADKIKGVLPDTKISLVCTTNICSKSIKLLKENKIEIITEEL